MTRSDLHLSRLINEANQQSLQMHTRRHFLKESAMGLGALAMGSLLGSCGHDANAGDPNAIAVMGELPAVIGMSIAQTSNMFHEVVGDPRVSFLLDAFG